MRTDCSSRLAAWPYCLSNSSPRPWKKSSRPFEIERFRGQAYGGFHIARSGIEIGFGLRRLIAGEIAQKHLLGLILQSDAERILLQEHLLGRQFGAQSVEEIPGAVGLVGKQASGARWRPGMHRHPAMPARRAGVLRVRGGEKQRASVARIVETAEAGQRDARLAEIGKFRRAFHVAEIAGMLLVVGQFRNVVANVVGEFAGVDEAIVVVIRKALEALEHGVSEGAVAAAELRAFLGNLARTGGHQAEHFAGGFAEFLDGAADGGGFEIADSSRRGPHRPAEPRGRLSDSSSSTSD